MSFLLEADERLGAGLERTIREQVRKLLSERETGQDNPSAFAHKARVRAKKIRAALRLARPLVGAKTYRKANRWWRDAARTLSGLRDAGARLEALQALEPFLAPRIGPAMMWRLTRRFEGRHQVADASDAIAEFCSLIGSGKAPTPDMPAGSARDAIKSLTASYRAARRTMRDALEDRTPENLHEWRKQTKYHALQTRLMRTQFPEVLLPRLGAARDLSDVLGEVQDIEIVLEGVKGWRDAPPNFREVLSARREQLVAEAERAGRALFADKPRDWAGRLAMSDADSPLDPQEEGADL